MENTNQPPTKINKTWFIQRGDNPNDIFACEEQEAWGLFQNRTNWMRRDFKIIGVSDGSTYVKVLNESKGEVDKAQSEVASLSRDLTRYLDTKDNLKFKELLPDTDEKMIRLNGLIKELEDKIEEQNKILNNAQKYMVDKAFKAELEIARGHIEMPSNFDVMTPNGDRDRILRQLGK
jgi:hypothetical protein